MSVSSRSNVLWHGYVAMFSLVVLQLQIMLLYPVKLTGTLLSAATSEDLQISFLDLTIVRWILFQAQF